jgi:hypothetical protein
MTKSTNAINAIETLLESGRSEGIAVGECLEMIASNADGMETDSFLATCADEIIEAATYFKRQIANRG